MKYLIPDRYVLNRNVKSIFPQNDFSQELWFVQKRDGKQVRFNSLALALRRLCNTCPAVRGGVSSLFPAAAWACLLVKYSVETCKLNKDIQLTHPSEIYTLLSVAPFPTTCLLSLKKNLNQILPLF